MSVALKKVDGVASVNVTLKEGLARVTLKPGNKVTLAELRRLVERNGFTPQGAAVVAEAEEVSGAGRQSQIKVIGVEETFLLAATTAENVRGELKKQTGKRIVVEGVIPAQKDNPKGAIDVKDVKAAGK